MADVPTGVSLLARGGPRRWVWGPIPLVGRFLGEVALLQPDQVRATLSRERDRTDRTGQPFSLVLLREGRLGGDRAVLRLLAKLVSRRVRSLDQVGLYDDEQLAVVLTATAEPGARTVAESIRQRGALDGLNISYAVHAYPSDGEGQRAVPPPSSAASRGVPDQPPPSVTETPFVRTLPTAKRALDVFVAFLALALASPLMVLVAVAIKLSSPGPVLFRQERAGLGGSPFAFLKFRTMRVNAEAEKPLLLPYNEQSGPVFKMTHDPRVTGVGWLLRRASIDELPQLWNVIRGEMSLVGPRPPTLDEVTQYAPWQMKRLSVTPGITCIWQVSGRAEIGFEDWVRMDIRYSRTRSILLDLWLLFRTVPAVLSGRGAH